MAALDDEVGNIVARLGDASDADALAENRTVSPYLTTERVANRLRCSVRSIHELTRLHRIPRRRLPCPQRCLFLDSDLEAGAELEATALSRGGRVVIPRPKSLLVLKGGVGRDRLP